MLAVVRVRRPQALWAMGANTGPLVRQLGLAEGPRMGPGRPQADRGPPSPPHQPGRRPDSTRGRQTRVGAPGGAAWGSEATASGPARRQAREPPGESRAQEGSVADFHRCASPGAPSVGMMGKREGFGPPDETNWSAYMVSISVAGGASPAPTGRPHTSRGRGEAERPAGRPYVIVTPILMVVSGRVNMAGRASAAWSKGTMGATMPWPLVRRERKSWMVDSKARWWVQSG